MWISKIALLTPYKDKSNQPIHAYTEENNLEVKSISTLDLDNDVDIARIPLGAIFNAAKITDPGGA